jgi:hypothetical protein
MKKLAFAVLLLASAPAFAGGSATGTIPYKSSLCNSRGGTFTFERRRVGSVYIVIGHCDLGTIDENILP